MNNVIKGNFGVIKFKSCKTIYCDVGIKNGQFVWLKSVPAGGTLTVCDECRKKVFQKFGV